VYIRFFVLLLNNAEIQAMRKISILLLFCSFVHCSFGQKKLSTYISMQYNKTLYDLTKGNNPWGLGFGVQTVFKSRSVFKPIIDLTGDAYLDDDKVLRTDSSGVPLNDVGGMINFFAGASFAPAKNLFFSFVAGPGFTGGQLRFGIKPSVGFYFSGNQKWMGKIAYINIFNRGKTTKEDFGSLSFTVGRKLF